MRLIPFQVAHADELIADGLNKNAPQYNDSTWKDWARSFTKKGMGFSGIENGHLVGSAGLVKVWDGVFEGWFLGGWRLHNNRFAAIRSVRRELDRMIEDNNIHRLQCVVKADWNEAQKFIEFLGWENEGLMKKYSKDGEDFFRYAKVR